MPSSSRPPLGGDAAPCAGRTPPSASGRRPRARRRRIYWRRRLIVLACLGRRLSRARLARLRAGATQARHLSEPGRSRSDPVHLPSLVPLVPAVTRFSGTLAAAAVPFGGQSAVFVQGVGLLGATADERSVPMASVTKVMTAVIVLAGPSPRRRLRPTFTMTAADHAAWIQAVDARRLQPRGRRRRAPHRAPAARGAHDPLGLQHRRLPRPLGRREHPRLRAEDERHGGRARPQAHPLRGRERRRPRFSEHGDRPGASSAPTP